MGSRKARMRSIIGFVVMALAAIAVALAAPSSAFAEDAAPHVDSAPVVQGHVEGDMPSGDSGSDSGSNGGGTADENGVIEPNSTPSHGLLKGGSTGTNGNTGKTTYEGGPSKALWVLFAFAIAFIVAIVVVWVRDRRHANESGADAHRLGRDHADDANKTGGDSVRTDDPDKSDSSAS